MTELARNNLRHMSREELAGLYAYLTSTLSDVTDVKGSDDGDAEPE